MRRIAALALLLSVPPSLQAQWLKAPTPGVPRLVDGRPNLNAPAPRAADGKPDLSGVWAAVRGQRSNALYLAGSLDEIPLRPAAREIYNRRLAADGAGRPAERCLPHGLPTDMLLDGGFRIVQTPALTVILVEYGNGFRQVPTYPRKLVDDPQPTWRGYSTGRWESDEFVIETTGFNDETWLDNRGLPHSDALRLTERFQRLNVGSMNLTLTVDDPKTYTRPWSISIKLELIPDTDLLEWICENNKYAPAQGSAK